MGPASLDEASNGISTPHATTTSIDGAA